MGDNLSKNVFEVKHRTWMLPAVLMFFRAFKCTFSYQAIILDLVTVEDWDEEKFGDGVDVKWKKWARGALA